MFLFNSADNPVETVVPLSANATREDQATRSPSLSPSSASQGDLESGLRERILSLDRTSFLQQILKDKLDDEIASVPVKSRRKSTLYQQEVAWRALQVWLQDNPERSISKKDMLHFCLYLSRVKKLRGSTILNYRSSLARPILLSSGVDLTDSDFKDLDKALYLAAPPPKKRIPEWDVDKVLSLLSSPKYCSSSAKPLDLLRKTVFLLALATGNRVSELAAIDASAIQVGHDDKVTLPVDPTFRYKNERENRTPPDICLIPLANGNPELCPVRTLFTFKERLDISTGKLLVNTRTKSPLKPSSISLLLCSLINEADPNKFPKGHDVRKVAASLAWTRGLPIDEIVRRCFWSRSSIFIRTYLVNCRGSDPVVALNTERLNDS